MPKDSFFWKTLSLARALISGQDVSKERLAARLELCSNCELAVHSGSLMRCSVCGCVLRESGLINLARYKTTEDYGCKHPDGSVWVRAGVDPPPGEPDDGSLYSK